ncbi:MAG TPA: hypothetical protein H9716_00400 [Candidatus Enterocloster faecavium]|uniref:DUF4064 domain-containing protein n=1 Tax=Candidatus Enterocloster faecavium TaxID=2838560 RepID=A0A9D2L5I9_9FIRM|nr:hypothetical protein [Candidatus Enterocloster faecavium]
MDNKNKLLRIASILMIVCAAAAILIAAVNTGLSLNSVANMSAEERAAVEAQLSEGGLTMDQAMTAMSGIAYVSLGMNVIFNAVKIIVGILGIRKADNVTTFFLVWGIILLVFGVLSLSGGISLLGICNLLGGIVAPVLFIVGGNQNKRRGMTK